MVGREEEFKKLFPATQCAYLIAHTEIHWQAYTDSLNTLKIHTTHTHTHTDRHAICRVQTKKKKKKKGWLCVHCFFWSVNVDTQVHMLVHRFLS